MRRTMNGTRTRLAAFEARAEPASRVNWAEHIEPFEAVAICRGLRALDRGEEPDIDDDRTIDGMVERLGLVMIGGETVATRLP